MWSSANKIFSQQDTGVIILRVDDQPLTWEESNCQKSQRLYEPEAMSSKEQALQIAHMGMHSECENMRIPVQTQARPTISVDRRGPSIAKKPPAN
ncbi:hypothetical protein LEMLEM_LOCUS18711 [Lemmus lemmus]